MLQKQYSRTLRSKKQRWMLWQSTKGKCAACGSEITPKNFHADHIISYRDQPRTNVHEMQPLCRDCNLKKGAQSWTA